MLSSNYIKIVCMSFRLIDSHSSDLLEEDSGGGKLIAKHGVLLQLSFLLFDREGLFVPIVVVFVSIGVLELFLVLRHLFLLLGH